MWSMGLVQIQLLPSDIYTFVFNLEYAYWSHKNVTPDEVSTLYAAMASCQIRCCLSCPHQCHVGVEPELCVNTATGAWASPRSHVLLPTPANACAGDLVLLQGPLLMNRSPVHSWAHKPYSREGWEVPTAGPCAWRCCLHLSLYQARAQILGNASFSGQLRAPEITALTFCLHGLVLWRCLGNRNRL